MIHSNIASEIDNSASYDMGATDGHEGHALITLRRSGKRPLAFRGAPMACSMSFRVGTPFWYELNVFKAASGGFVADVRHFTKAEGEQDKFTVFVADDLEQILDFFEGYNPAQDIPAEITLDDHALPASELAFQALSLRLKIEEAKSQYESMVSEIFAELEADQSAMN